MTGLIHENVSWESILIITQKGPACYCEVMYQMALAVYILIWVLVVF